MRCFAFLRWNLMALLVLQALPGFTQHSANLSGDMPVRLDELITAYAKAGIFNGSVLISEQGHTLLEKGYGYSNLPARTLNTADTKYPVYSVTKSMTATIILQLAEKGILKLDDRLSRFYPDFPAADSITITHLLTHTSGLYAYNNDYSMPTGSETAMLRFLAARPLAFRPGSQWQYSNTGYYFLGFIVEKVTGQFYGDALKSHLFGPLNMSESGIDFRSLQAPGKATGYRFIYPDSGKEARLYPQEELRSSGGVWSTVKDLLKFHEGLQGYRIISPSSTLQAYNIYKNRYGFGWFVDSVNGRQVISHSGGAAGFRSLLVRIPESNTCIVLLANGENFDLEVLKDDILKLLSGKRVPYPYSIKTDSALLAGISGTYRLEPGRSLYISSINNRLIAQVSGQEPVLLLADSSGVFRVAGMDGHLAFTGSIPGSYDSVTLFRKGRRHMGVKINASWGIAGNALPGGWEGPDLPLDAKRNDPGKWSVTKVKLRNGFIKFRFNSDWTRNLGKDAGAGTLVDNGADIKVREGSYTITLDLRDPSQPGYTIQKSNP